MEYFCEISKIIIWIQPIYTTILTLGFIGLTAWNAVIVRAGAISCRIGRCHVIAWGAQSRGAVGRAPTVGQPDGGVGRVSSAIYGARADLPSHIRAPVVYAFASASSSSGSCALLKWAIARGVPGSACSCLGGTAASSETCAPDGTGPIAAGAETWWLAERLVLRGGRQGVPAIVVASTSAIVHLEKL